MNIIKWFRKNTKKLLAFFGVLLMVGFLLPSFSGRGGCSSRGRSPLDFPLGHITDASGNQQAITMQMLHTVDNHLLALQSLRIEQYSSMLKSIKQVAAEGYSAGVLEEINPFTVEIANVLLFGNTENAQWFRQVLRRQAGTWAETKQEEEEYIRYVDELVGSQPEKGKLYFILLADEAKRMGIHATQDQISQMIRLVQNWFSLLRQMNASQAQYIPSFSSVLSQYRITEDEMRDTVGDYLSILRYADLVSRNLALSEVQLRKKILDQSEQSTVSGEYVTFNARLFLDRVPEPSEEEIGDQFKRYQDIAGGEPDEENPFGFGYLLPDRVRVEYLKVDVSKAEKIVQDEFEKLEPEDQEETLQQFWINNKLLFRQESRENDTPDDPGTPSYYDPEFYEIADQKVLPAWEMRESLDKAEQLILAARQLADKDMAPPGEGDTDRVSGGSIADYAEIADQLNTGPLILEYGKTEYFDRSNPPVGLQFDRTRQSRRGFPVQDLLEMLFKCEPLFKGVLTRLDPPLVRLNENISDLMTVDYGNNVSTFYLMRITGVDPERPATSLSDDGRAGPADREFLEPSTLRKKVISDLKELSSFNLARDRAREFSREAAADWEAALDRTKKALMQDPNRPVSLNVSDLASVRDQADRMLNMLQQQDPQNLDSRLVSIYLDNIEENTRLLKESMKLAREHEEAGGIPAGEEDSSCLAVLEQPIQQRCLVFKELQVTPPYQEDYQRRKPLITERILQQNQQLFTVIHFNPENIIKRTGFTVPKAAEVQEGE
ncbi:MAG: hypothetical protein JW860_00240 [Sedimentisphaerales bacterium]|nr:hypothetical protein [Sedimentisphaerales bacterium]